MKLSGIFPTLPTPFDYKGDLYKTKVEHNVAKWNLLSLAGYVVGDTVGEGHLLEPAEKARLWELVARYARQDRLLIAGVAVEGVREAVTLANRAAELGYHAALAEPPLRSSDACLFFRAVADGSRIPVILAARNGLSADAVLVLSAHTNIAGAVLSSGEMAVLRRITAGARPGFHVLGGSPRACVEALEQGAHGLVLDLAAAIPYVAITIWEALRTREAAAARDWQARMQAAADLVEKHGVPALKCALDLNSYYGGPPRLPLSVVPPAVKREMEAALADLKG